MVFYGFVVVEVLCMWFDGWRSRLDCSVLWLCL